jgi:hypothetical protein
VDAKILLTPENLTAWIALLSAAVQLGGDVYRIVDEIATKTLTPEQYAELVTAWQEDKARAAHNAGIADPLP